MGRYLALLGIVGIAACGGSTTGTNPPPPPPSVVPGAPASLSIQAGDGQQADPGQPLPIRPLVLVKDAAGRAVPGVIVSFAVESGGGSVSPATVTTGADGLAAADWTLGSAEGSQVLVASAGSLTAVRVAATARFPLVALITGATVPSTGGTVTYTKAGDPLSGVSIEVPDSAYPAPTTFSVSATQGLDIPLPAGVKRLGPAFLVSNAKGFADMPMALHLPLHAGGDSVIATFFYDPATGTLEGVPLMARDDSSVTVASSHFSADQMMVTGGAGVGLRAQVRAGAPTVPLFGQVYIVGVVAAPGAADVPVSSGFTPGLDDWEFKNLGNYAKMQGVCAGMSVTAMYYFYRFRLRGGLPLFHQYDTFTNLDFDNPQGERLVGAVQRDMNWTGSNRWLAFLSQLTARSRIPYAQLVYESLALTLNVTHLPQYLALRSSTRKGGHAVVAYATGNGSISFADPNFPGNASRIISYAAGAFTPVSLKLVASGPGQAMDTVHLLGSSALISRAMLDRRWGEFAQKNVGPPYFPTALEGQVFDPVAAQWVPIPSNDVIVTNSRVLAIRTLCAQCTGVRGTAPANRVNTDLRDTTNTLRATDILDVDSAAVIVFGRGPGSFRVSLETFYPNNAISPQWGLVDQRFITIVTAPFIVSPAADTSLTSTNITFTAENAGVAKADWTFVWDFNDGTPLVSVVGDSTVTHKWANPGTYTLKSELRNPAGQVVARDQAPVVIQAPRPAWHITSFTLQSVSGPPSTQNGMTDDSGIFTGMLGTLLAHPDKGYLFLLDQRYHGPVPADFHWFFPMLRLQVASASNNQLLVTNGGSFTLGGFEWARQCTPAAMDPIFTSNTCSVDAITETGTLTSGTLVGASVGVTNVSLQMNTVIFRVDAAKNGPVLSGTLTMIDLVHFIGPILGTRTEIYAFSATLAP